MLGLDEFIYLYPCEISGGQNRKLQLILALLKSPRILVLDELTTGVDAKSKQSIQKVLENLKDTTILMATHSFEESEMISSRIVVMQKGHISFCGTAAEMRKRYNCEYNITIIDGEPHMKPILKVIRDIVPEAIISQMHKCTISIPNDIRVVDVLEKLDSMKFKLGFEKYTIYIRSLEEAMRKIIEQDELEFLKHY